MDEGSSSAERHLSLFPAQPCSHLWFPLKSIKTSLAVRFTTTCQFQAAAKMVHLVKSPSYQLTRAQMAPNSCNTRRKQLSKDRAKSIPHYLTHLTVQGKMQQCNAQKIKCIPHCRVYLRPQSAIFLITCKLRFLESLLH